MILSVVQPAYYAGDNPDKLIADFLLNNLNNAKEDELIVLPEYTNAGGLTDKDAIISALPRAKEMLDAVSEIAKEKKCYIAINVLQQRGDRLFNSTYLFSKNGNAEFCYDKVHLPPAEVDMGVCYGSGSCTCEIEGIRFAFMTCYDVYFNEQIEAIAKFKPDIIIIPGYQRGERTDIIRAQAKLTAFRCNSFIARASYSMNDEGRGGCSLIAAPDGEILVDFGKETGVISREINPKWKYMRTAGFGGALVRNDVFISNGIRKDLY